VGSPAAPGDFDDFYRREYHRLLAFITRLGATAEEANDAAQDAMIEAYQRWATIENPAAWARTVASRRFLRTAVRRRDEVHRALAAGGWADPDPAVTGLPAIEERQQILAALDALPPTQRAVMALVVDGYTAVETAELLGKTPETVRSNLMHARRRLKQLLAHSLDRVDEHRVRLSYQVGQPDERAHQRVVSVRADRDCDGLDLLVVAAPGRTRPESAGDGHLLGRFSGLTLVGGEAETFDVELPGRVHRPYLLRCFVEPPDRFAVVDPPIHQLLAA
jgi:RNA polymerase sigma factor (sigma-70 family)